MFLPPDSPPPDSPDGNPIERAFSKIRALLKKAATRKDEHLSEAVREAIDSRKPDEVRNDFTAAGYEPE